MSGDRESPHSTREKIARPTGFRVRTLMIGVGVVALLAWGGMAGSRSYDYARRSRGFAKEGRLWGDVAARRRIPDPKMAKFASECADYYENLARKYHRAMWQPLRPVAPDPPAPGSEHLRRQ